MGAGLAKQIARKYPKVKRAYIQAHKKDELTLGSCQLVNVSPELYVANLAGQDNYGTSTVQTDYDALRESLQKLGVMNKDALPIYIPYKLGCGLAGGDWDTVLSILEEELVSQEWYICKV
jgi:hypothetical protein